MVSTKLSLGRVVYSAAMILMLTITIGVVLRFVVPGSTAPLQSDGRIPIVVSSEERDFVLAEMRSFLDGVRQINEAAIDNDRNAIAAAAAPLGREVETHAPSGLPGKLPLGFKRLGFSVHDDFDWIAESAASAEMIEIQRQLNSTLEKCVTCHATYSLAVE